MNLFDSSFLCLDIGSHAVRAVAHRVKSGRITKSAITSAQSADPVFAIKSVVDELERQIGGRFDSAYITGNFGRAEFEMSAKSTQWSSEHRITAPDVRNQITQISPPDGFYPMHIIPLRYDTSVARNLLTPVGYVDRHLASVFGTIFYEDAKMRDIFEWLRAAHIQADAFFDPSYLMDTVFRDKKQNAMFIDMGGEFTTVSIWSGRGPVFFKKIPLGQIAITKSVSVTLGICVSDAERIKCSVTNADTGDMDRFTPADSAYDFSRADMNDVVMPMLMEIISEIKESATTDIAKYSPSKIFLCGGGSGIKGIDDLIEITFGIPVQNLGADAAARALSAHVWAEQSGRVKTYLARRERFGRLASKITTIFQRKEKKTTRFIPIMPTTLSFNMKSPATYELFKSGGISMIHVDVMDGFFVDRVVGGIEELKQIREHTDAHLHVHLMTESPAVWAAAAANAGADTIIVSTNTAGVRSALRKIREMGKRSGIALNPESGVDILKPVLKEIDEVLVMSVKPGAGGQKFDEGALNKISVLANTRKRYGLKFKISVDGGINPETAQMCWAAGADFLASGSYLAHSADFPIAVQSLMPQE